MPVDHSNLQSVLSQIEKTYGDDSIRFASEKSSLTRISTGSLQLDFATGGGIPIGRWLHWYGNYGSAKTLTALKTIASAQKLGMTCALYNIEKRFSEEWARRVGVNTKELVLVEGTEIEYVGTKMESLIGVVNVHVVDSVAASVSIDELASDVEDWQRALGPRVWGKVIRRVNNKFDEDENCIIFINQVRSNMQYGGGDEPPGGKAINFASSLSLRFRKSSWLYYDKNGNLSTEGTNKDTATGDTEPHGMEFQVKLDKSTVSEPHRTARLRLDFKTGEFDQLWDLSMLGIYFGVFEKTSEKSAWYQKNGNKYQGEKQVREALAQDEKLREEVKNAVLSRA